jgi:hypothetical protein
MIVNGNLRQGQFNYDTDNARFQLRNGILSGNIIRNMDFVSCKLSGVFENCNFIGSTIERSRIDRANFIRGNVLKESYASRISVNQENEIDRCYIVNSEEMINCNVKESVIKFATPGKRMKADDRSTIVIKQMPLPVKSDAVHVEEIRDYSWIKKMRKSEDKGFQNEYSKNKYMK